MTSVYLGVAEGSAVQEPIGHLAIFGQTRRAGKTTTLRTLVGEAVMNLEADALVFRTGREEIPFPGARRMTPYFRARLDWRGVEAMLWTFLAEKPKVYRPLIMDAVRGARSLEEVHRNIVAKGAKSKNGWVADRTKELDAYFQEILPWLKQHPLAAELELEPGLNVVDLEGWPETVQQLVVAATLERLMELGKNGSIRLVILPEARRFIPSDRATPAKLSADRLAREGAKLNLFLWIDSQSLTGVDQLILRNFALLLQGVQTSDIEIRRICAAIDGVKPAMVRALRVGDFILHTQEGVRTVHVPLVEPKEDPNVDAKERRVYEDTISRLRAEVAQEHERAEANARAAAANAVGTVATIARPSEIEAVARALRAPHGATGAAGDDGQRERIDLHVQHEVPSLTVHVVEKRIEANEQTYDGKLALLIAEGFFDEKKSTGPIGREFAARGWGNPTSAGGSQGKALRETLEQLCRWGFLRNLNSMYDVRPDARSRIHVVKDG